MKCPLLRPTDAHPTPLQLALWAQAFCLSYRVGTSNEYHPFYIQNLKFLQDFWTHPFTLARMRKRRFWKRSASILG